MRSLQADTNPKNDDWVWIDRATEINGEAVTYDAIGNPTAIGDVSLLWDGRTLRQYADDTNVYNYVYDMSGRRKTKSVNGTQTKFYYEGNTLAAQQTGSTKLTFMFDAKGAAYGFFYNSNPYFYIRNLQGDIVGITNPSGNVIGTYVYDAWGNLIEAASDISDPIAQLNPLRYRGYYYDAETGFYFLNSRYYNPRIGRFLNADASIGQIGNIQSTNVFAYCFNNPVNMSDPTGNWPKLSTIFTVVAVSAVAVAAVAAVAVTVVTCGAAAPALALAGGGIIGGISTGAVATAASVATSAMIVAGVSTAAALTSTVAEEAVEKTAKRNNSVYVLKDDTGTVQYVGRTNNVDKRRAAHSANPARAGLRMEVIASELNLPEARALEQAGMAYYHTINTANKMNNQINSVSPKYWGAFKGLALGTLNYGWNQMSNEILYWTGN